MLPHKCRIDWTWKNHNPIGILQTKQASTYIIWIRDSIWYTNGKEMQRTPTMVWILWPPFHRHFALKRIWFIIVQARMKYARIEPTWRIGLMPIVWIMTITRNVYNIVPIQLVTLQYYILECHQLYRCPKI
jgi:hypothetical protein